MVATAKKQVIRTMAKANSRFPGPFAQMRSAYYRYLFTMDGLEKSMEHGVEVTGIKPPTGFLLQEQFKVAMRNNCL